MDVQIIRLQDVNIKEGLVKIISLEKSICGIVAASTEMQIQCRNIAVRNDKIIFL